jgi:N-methylhydantoinase A
VKLAGRHALNSNDLKAAFEGAYRAQIGQPLDNIPIRLINLRVAAVAKRPNLDLRAMAPKDGVMLQDAFLEMRSIWADGIWQEAPVYDRLALGVGQKCMGPALLEQADTTIFVDPGLIGEVDEFGNLIILPEA